MFPSRYNVYRDASYFNDQGWAPIGYSTDSDTSVPAMLNEDPWGFPSPSQSIPAPGNVPKHSSAWKSWMFMIGRRERQLILFCIPRLSVWWTAFLAMLKILRDRDQKFIKEEEGHCRIDTDREHLNILACRCHLVVDQLLDVLTHRISFTCHTALD